MTVVLGGAFPAPRTPAQFQQNFNTVLALSERHIQAKAMYTDGQRKLDAGRLMQAVAQSKIDAADAVIAKSDARIAKADTTIARCQENIAKRDVEIAKFDARDAELSARDAELTKQKAALQAKADAIRAMLAAKKRSAPVPSAIKV